MEVVCANVVFMISSKKFQVNNFLLQGNITRKRGISRLLFDHVVDFAGDMTDMLPGLEKQPIQ
jgi:hypothetical protein